MTARKKPAAAKAAAATPARSRAQPSHAVRSIPLDRLRLSTLYNVRTTQEEPVEPLADSIAAKGLLQNLIGSRARWDCAAGIGITDTMPVSGSSAETL